MTSTIRIALWVQVLVVSGAVLAGYQLGGTLRQCKPSPRHHAPAYELEGRLFKNAQQSAQHRQELFCKDAMPSDFNINSKSRTTPLGDAMNSTLIRIDPAPAYVTVYGGSQDIVSGTLLSGEEWEGFEMKEILWALVQPLPVPARGQIDDQLFVDVGANVGVFTMNAAARGFSVVAVEGLQSNQWLLRMALCASAPEIRRRVTFHATGLGAAKSRCFIMSGNQNRGDGIARCGISEEALRNVPGYSIRGRMDIERLDTLVQQDIKVLKVDVEGFEPFVFDGMTEIFNKYSVWYIMMEYNKALLDASLVGTNRTRFGFLKDTVMLGYKASLKSFRGPFVGLEQLEAMDKDTEQGLPNIYLVKK